MPNRNKRKPKQREELGLFRNLKGYVDSVARGEMRKGRIYSLCVRASFAKCYEFNIHAWDDNNTETIFFWLPTLRGICEDLIVLNYIQSIPSKERESLVSGLMRHDLQDRLRTQYAFFKHSRPQQPVLGPSLTTSQLNTLENDIRNIWQAHGWPNMNRNVMPPIRQMAEKHRGEMLATLYDYLYRLTSGMVHFNVSGLLRTGWGDLPHCTFSPTHFYLYCGMFGRVYGAFMFCSYFELFARFLRTDDNVKNTVNAIRQAILREPRWPEMITPEEMNIEPPKIGVLQHVFSIMQSESEKRLLK